jgi:hypothetical protein
MALPPSESFARLLTRSLISIKPGVGQGDYQNTAFET